MPEQSPIATVVQCHKCQKRLKYAGKKPSIACPGCGESVPVPDNIQEGEPVVSPPPVQSTPQASLSPPVNEAPKQFDFANREAKANQWIVKVKAMPRFPVVLSVIWGLWMTLNGGHLLLILILFEEIAGPYFVTCNGDLLSTSGVISGVFCLGTVTGVPSVVASVIAYFWLHKPIMTIGDAPKP